MKFFWEEQQKYLKSSSTGISYHPMVMRYCLSLAAKSSSAYDEIRYDEKTWTGFFMLPSRRRLRDYKNYIKPQCGFNNRIVNELRNKIKTFSKNEKFIVLLMDEIKIQENLVWDKHSGELISYADLGDVNLNYATLSKVEEITTHVLVFLIRSIVNPHFHVTPEDEMTPDVDITCRTVNLFRPEKRFIYFTSDVPHLLKTTRNCLSNSGSDKFTRYMWNEGRTPYSTMNVKLDAQVLRSTVSRILSQYGPPEASGTARFACLWIYSLI